MKAKWLLRTIETDRLYLRELTGSIWEDILLNGTDEEINRLLGTPVGKIASEKQKAKGGFSTFNKSLLVFHLFEKHSNQLIGWCGFHTWYRDHNRAEIGYGLFSDDVKRKGLMTEAMAEILRCGFDEMKLNRVEAFIGSDNTASRKLLQKFGFQYEGNLRGHYLAENRYEDSQVYGLLSTEYENSRRF